MRLLIDANLVLRYLLNDLPEQANAVEKLFKHSDKELILLDITIAEVIWVLNSVYQLNKEAIIVNIRAVLNVKTINTNKNFINRALQIYSENNLSFIDSYHLAYCQKDKLEGIYSFDEGLDKVKSVKRFKP